MFFLRKEIIYINILLLPLILISCKKDVIVPEKVTLIRNEAKGALNKILFLNDTEGYIIGGNRYHWADLLSTNDGGKNWTLINNSGDDHKSIYGLSHYGERVYAVGYDGKIFIKPAPDIPWQRVQTAWWEMLQDVTFTGPNTGYIVAGMGFGNGRVFIVDSLGAINRADSFDFELSSVVFPTPQTGYTAGYGAILKTENAGASWNLLNVRGDFFKGIYCIDDQRLWVVGFNGSIMHSRDGGKNWEQQRNGNNPLLKSYKLRAVLFKDPLTGYVAGDKGLLLKTTDGGNHWSEFEHFTNNDLRCIALHPDGSIWVGGDTGTLYRIED